VSIDVFDLERSPMLLQEAQGPPLEWLEGLRQRVRAADAVLFAVPEYGHSITRVLDQLIISAAQSPDANAWSGKPVALMGASARYFERALAQHQLKALLTANEMLPIVHPEVLICNAHLAFDRQGGLKSRPARAQLRALVESLSAVVRQCKLDVAPAGSYDTATSPPRSQANSFGSASPTSLSSSRKSAI
jgi:chromate reductase